jgi:hypothetical protein
MATLKALRGSKIEYLAADPSNLTAGQIWYNSTSGTLKFYNGSGTETVTVS